ncbi:hypothetical protein OAG36_00605 [bacterium]|nr:hypothetical protein [bacterium]
MALDALTVWEVDTGGDDTNGGGYVSDAGTTDYSQQTSAQLSLTDIDQPSASSTTITSATGGFTDAMVGNIINLSSGTNLTVGLYEIATRVDTNTITLDRFPDDGTALTGDTVGKVGGAFATPGKLVDALTVAGMIAWIKTGTYTLTTATPGAAGPLNLSGTTVTVVIKGYNSTRGDLDGQSAITNKPVIDAGAITSITILDMTPSNTNTAPTVIGIVVDGNSGTSNNGIIGNNIRQRAVNCHARDCPGTGFTATAISCEADGCGDGFTAMLNRLCVAHGCTRGFKLGAEAVLTDCVAYSNTVDGFGSSGFSNRSSLVNCIADDNGGDGFDTGSGVILVNCVSTNNTGPGYRTAGASVLWNCFHYNNTGGDTIGTFEDATTLSELAGDPWDATGDYRPIATGGGAELRAASTGFVGWTHNQNAGGVQHADPAGGAGGLLTHPGMTGGMRG